MQCTDIRFRDTATSRSTPPKAASAGGEVRVGAAARPAPTFATPEYGCMAFQEFPATGMTAYSFFVLDVTPSTGSGCAEIAGELAEAVLVCNVIPLEDLAERRKWAGFLDTLVAEDASLAAAGSAVQSFWASALRAMPAFRLPITSANERGIELSWRSRDGKHLDVEFLRDGTCDWFYRDSRQDVIAGSDEPVRELPSKFWAFASAFGDR